MALVTVSANAGFDTVEAQRASRISGLLAGEDLLTCAPCYIKGSDGKVYMSNGTAANEAAGIDGFTGRAVKAGEPVTLYGKGTRMGYADGTLTPGAKYFIGATAGRLDSAATTGDAVGVAQAIDAFDIRVTRDSD